MDKHTAENVSFPIDQLYAELDRVIVVTDLESNVKVTKAELRAAVKASRDLSVTEGEQPRYDLFHNVFKFVKVRLDVQPHRKSALLRDWAFNNRWLEVVKLYDYSGGV